jgi:hypothetical protein
VVQFYYLYFLFGLVEDVQNGRGGLGYFGDAVVGDLIVFFLVEEEGGLYCLHIEDAIIISLTFLVDDSICY